MDRIFLKAIEELVEKGEMVEPIKDPTSPHSGFGSSPGNTREVRGWSVSTTDIRARIPRNRARNARLDQAIGMALWCFRATSSLSVVEFYNSNARRFSDDRINIRAPWGVRLLSGGKASPFNRALDTLRRDPASLRAVVPVFNADDIGVSSRDIPCLIAIHLMIRNDKLHMTCQLRSLNPYWVWAYDHFFLTMLLEFGGCLLDREPGSLTYQISSLQIDERDLALAVEALAQPCKPCPVMPPMDAQTDWEVLNRVLAVETQLRGVLAAGGDDWREGFRLIESSKLPPWWDGLLRALCGSYLLRYELAPSDAEAFIPEWAKP